MNLRFFDRHGRDYTDNAVGYLKWDLFGDKIDHHLVGDIDNAFDKYYYYGGFGYTRAFPGAPRNLKVSLGYSF